MIAMQYTITLPADYDMAIIRRRIADKGHLLDDWPGLVFKAYLHAARDDDTLPGRDNLYAPFYVWRDSDAMNAFLCGAGFAGLARDFGRPTVRTWSVWQANVPGDLRGAVAATREVVPIPAATVLDTLQQAETEATRHAMDEGALAAVVALDPTGWTRVRLRLWSELRHVPDDGDPQHYRVGHVSQPGAPR